MENDGQRLCTSAVGQPKLLGGDCAGGVVYVYDVKGAIWNPQGSNTGRAEETKGSMKQKGLHKGTARKEQGRFCNMEWVDMRWGD